MNSNQTLSSLLPRRQFLKTSLTATVAAPMVLSLEERVLAQTAAVKEARPEVPSFCKLWQGTIGKVKISRLICGGNLISGYAHSRDLIYVSDLLLHYFTDEKIMETWALCERYGINTMIFNPQDEHAVKVWRKYYKNGGRIQYIAQVSPKPGEFKTVIKQAVDDGAVGAFLVGNYGDEWTRDQKLDWIAQLVALIKEQGIIAGVAGHEVRTPMAVEKAGIAPDFYVKTLHGTNYWSRRRPGQDREVIDNYGADNYWCKDPRETIRFMSDLERPWIAYKVLAAGAIHPQAGFRHAFENGADFALVGMFDFQVAECATMANDILSNHLTRERDWVA